MRETAATRRKAASDQVSAERSATLGRLLYAGAWPFGMPTSVNPLVVALGASPGNSPAATPWKGIAPQLPYPPPTFGEPHIGLFYPDGSSYWTKMRLLLAGLVRVIDPGASDDDALAVSGHLNLGTGLFGRATAAATEADITHWAARLIVGPLSPRILVTVGLDGLLKATELRAHLASGGLDVPWQRPHFIEQLEGYRYRFKLWRATRADGGSLTIVGWPNHPSRHPFGDSEPFPIWRRSIEQAVRLLATRI
jgi:hypothetical protein